MENIIQKENILDWYMEDKLQGNNLQNVYQFVSRHQMEETDFYTHFANLESIEQFFFEQVMMNSTHVLHQSEDFIHFNSKEKWLSFYYTFFENLRLHRSFVVELLGKKKLSNLKKLSGLRSQILQLAREIGYDSMDWKHKDVNAAQDRVIVESSWVNFLFVLQFWLHDDSVNFEKTDQLIEKSLQAKYKLMDREALNSVTDLGKFLVKEFSPFK